MIIRLLSNTRLMLLSMAGISAFALAMAYTAEYGFGLKPCILCLYQRIPFAVVIILGLAGAFMDMKGQKTAPVFLGLISLSFLINSIIAFYHTGVERKWWVSFLEGCATPDLSGDISALLARIQAAPAVRCDEIPWADPVLGLSMANYNVMFCLGLFVVSALSAGLMRRQGASETR